MLFSSLFFIFIFLPVSLLVYYFVPKHLKNLCLLIFSLIFYAWGEPSYVFLMLFAIFFGFAAGKFINHSKTSCGKKRALILSICVDVGMLVFFKYSGLFSKTISGLTGLPDFLPPIALPIGISFYTFESISYVVDIYRGDSPAQNNLINFGTYLSFFPHLVSGPIIRYRDMEKQLVNHTVTKKKFEEGCRRFLLGLFKKVLLADQLSQLTEKVRWFDSPSSLSAWIGALAFTFQIYFDFSGYTDMAVGLGHMFGFTLPENFNFPYLSRSASEFWRRWHMTLGGWFRDYLYIPLGGNRCSRLKNVRNLAIVWVLTGLWHGASWNFALWGAYWGVLIIIEKLFFQKILEHIPKFFGWLYAFVAAVVGWVFFEYTDLNAAFRMIRAMFGFAPGIDRLGAYSLITGGLLLLIAAIGCSSFPAHVAEKLRRGGKAGQTVWCVGYGCLAVLSVSAMVGNAYSPFLYFRF